jgi:hypothetical protein
MPSQAKVLCVQTQGGIPHIWAEVETDNAPVVRKFRVVGTGHAMPAVGLQYLGTYQVLDGALVWHVYEELAP